MNYKEVIILSLVIVCAVILCIVNCSGLPDTAKKPILFWIAGAIEDGKSRMEIPAEYGIEALGIGDIITNNVRNDRFLKEDPGLLEYYKNMQVSLWYHDDEKTPFITNYNWRKGEQSRFSPEPDNRPETLIDGKKWDEAVQIITDNFTHKIHPGGKRDMTQRGGVLSIIDVFERHPDQIPSFRFQAAPSGWAFDRLVDAEFDMNMGMYHGLQRFPKKIREGFGLIAEGEFFWYMGIKMQNPNFFFSVTDKDCFDRMMQMISMCDRSRTCMLMIDVQLRRGKEQVENFRKVLEYLTREFIPNNPGSRFVSSKSLARMIISEKGKTVPIGHLAKAVEILLKEWDGRPPKYIKLLNEYEYFSIADMYQALEEALSYYNDNKTLPKTVRTTELYGPICDIEEAPLYRYEFFRISEEDILRVAKELNNKIIANPADNSGLKPKNRIPHQVLLPNGYPVNAAEFLLLMAEVFKSIYVGNELKSFIVEPAEILPASVGIYEKVLWADTPYPLWYSKLQLWTLKPARWVSEEYRRY